MIYYGFNRAKPWGALKILYIHIMSTIEFLSKFPIIPYSTYEAIKHPIDSSRAKTRLFKKSQVSPTWEDAVNLNGVKRMCTKFLIVFVCFI